MITRSRYSQTLKEVAKRYTEYQEEKGGYKLPKQGNLKPSTLHGELLQQWEDHRLWCHSHGFKSHLKHIQLCELKHASAFM